YAVGNADPADAATCAHGRARAVTDYDAAGRPARRAHLHLAVRSGDRARCLAARAVSRRAGVLRRAATERSPRCPRVPYRGRAGVAGSHGARTDDANGARGCDDGLL